MLRRYRGEDWSAKEARYKRSRSCLLESAEDSNTETWQLLIKKEKKDAGVNEIGWRALG